MYKKALIFTLFCLITISMHAQNNFYAFVMHATPGAEFDQAAWQETTELLETLNDLCESTHYNESREAFDACIDLTIETIKGIFAASNNQTNFTVTLQLLRKPFIISPSGFSISIDTTLDPMPQEKYQAIEEILQPLESHQNTAQILNAIQPVFALSHGETWLRIHNLK